MISFIVPAYNEERLLGQTLASIHAAARALDRSYEIVVADDASTDRTAEIARENGARVVPVRLRQIAGTRNAGARAARGEILVFVDADTLVPSATLSAAMDALARGAVGGGAMLRVDGTIPRHGRVLLFLVATGMRLGRLAAGCFLFCTREAFEAAGGFDERLFATEELALSRALRRHGRMTILREAVETSGRKLRTHSAWELARLIGALVGIGPRILRSRDRLELWYGSRRPDPHVRVPTQTACER
ncbi:MAG TPA: glycosyltransferase [Vicinamibacterales bacterium]|jgi:glycosyltransferase involved in cell wall biosynthesis